MGTSVVNPRSFSPEPGYNEMDEIWWMSTIVLSSPGRRTVYATAEDVVPKSTATMNCRGCCPSSPPLGPFVAGNSGPADGRLISDSMMSSKQLFEKALTNVGRMFWESKRLDIRLPDWC